MVGSEEVVEGQRRVLAILDEVEAEHGAVIIREWDRPNLGVGRYPGETLHKLKIGINRRFTTVTFTESEITDCVSSGRDGRELGAQIKERLREAAGRLLGGTAERIGF